MRFLLAIIALCLVGCSTERQINPGGHPAMLIMQHDMLIRESGSPYAIGFRRGDRIGLSRQLDQDQTIADALHEVGHQYVHATGDQRIWNVLDDLGGNPSSPEALARFPVQCDEFPARRFHAWNTEPAAQEARAIYAALRLYRSTYQEPTP